MNKIRFKITGGFLKEFFKNISLILIILILIGLVYFSIQSEVQLKILESEEERLTQSRLLVISENISAIVTDLLFLTEQNELRSYLEIPDQEMVNLISLEYSFMAASKKVYRQIRYFDENGALAAGINYNNGNPKAIIEEKNFIEEYFFIEAEKLEKGEVFISPFEFVEEEINGEIFYRPMIFFATSIYSGDGDSKGVVILDYMADDLARKLLGNSSEVNDLFFLTSSEGRYLLSPQNQELGLFNKNKNTEELFLDDYPAAWEKIISYKNGQFTSENGIFSFESFDPTRVVEEMDLKDSGFHGFVIDPDLQKQHEWKIISLYPAENIYSARKNLAKNILLYLGIGMPIILIFSFIFTQFSALQKQTEEAMNLTSKVFDSTKEGMFIANFKGEIVNINRSLTLLTGFESVELIGKSPSKLIPEYQKAGFHSNMLKILRENGEWEGELVFIKKDQTFFDVSLSASSMFTEEGNVSNFIAVVNDITEKKNAEKYLQFLATHDVLTQLPNRSMLYESINHAVSVSKKHDTYAAVFFIDIDGFKNVNDTYGHQIGDQLLKEISKRLKNNIRDGDTIARISGDEFACVFENVSNPEAAYNIAEKLLEKIKNNYLINENLISISASIGISVSPDDGEKAEILLQRADQAMYEIKRRTKNGVILFSKINSQTSL